MVDLMSPDPSLSTRLVQNIGQANQPPEHFKDFLEHPRAFDSSHPGCTFKLRASGNSTVEEVADLMNWVGFDNIVSLRGPSRIKR
jgi:hypothetical protein